MAKSASKKPSGGSKAGRGDPKKNGVHSAALRGKTALAIPSVKNATRKITAATSEPSPKANHRVKPSNGTKLPLVVAARSKAVTVAAPAPKRAVDSPRRSADRIERELKPHLSRPPMPVPDAVPTDGRPRKNQAGLGLRELEHFRDLLLAKRRELVGDMSSMELEALRTSGDTNLSTLPIHMADMGTDNYEQEFTLGLVEKDRNLLRELNAALGKIQNGTYGICEGTGKPISKPRLEAQPWARFSIEYARTREKDFRF